MLLLDRVKKEESVLGRNMDGDRIIKNLVATAITCRLRWKVQTSRILS
jgi:hypothetical protein